MKKEWASPSGFSSHPDLRSGLAKPPLAHGVLPRRQEWPIASTFNPV
jgi:hypothetical protein